MKNKNKFLTFAFSLCLIAPLFVGCGCSLNKQLDTPEITFNKENESITWNSVEDATGYNIYCDNVLIDTVEDYDDKSYDLETTNLIYDLSSVINDSEIHKVNISSISSKRFFEDSKISNTVDYINLTPEKKFKDQEYIYNVKINKLNINDYKLEFNVPDDLIMSKYVLYLYTNTNQNWKVEVYKNNSSSNNFVSINLDNELIKLNEKDDIVSIRVGYNDGKNDIIVSAPVYLNNDNYPGFTDNIYVFNGKIYDYYIEDLQEFKSVIYYSYIYRDSNYFIKLSDDFYNFIKVAFSGRSINYKMNFAVLYGLSSFYETSNFRPLFSDGSCVKISNANKEFEIGIDYGKDDEPVLNNISIFQKRYQKSYEPYYEKCNYVMWKDDNSHTDNRFVSDDRYLEAPVKTSEQLYWAVENKTKPIFNTPFHTRDRGFVIYEEAKKILNSIISDEMNDCEKVLSIFDYLCVNTVYDFSATNLNIDGTSSPVYYLEGVFLNKDSSGMGYSVCDGFSKSFSLMCNMIGIDAVRIMGDIENGVNSGAHAWNKVFLDVNPMDNIDEECFVVDLTWTEFLLDNMQYEQSSHLYYLLSDKDISATHKEFKYNNEFKVYKAESNYNFYENFKFEYGNGVDKKYYNYVVDSDEDLIAILNNTLDEANYSCEFIVEYDYMKKLYKEKYNKNYNPRTDMVIIQDGNNNVQGVESRYARLTGCVADKMKKYKFKNQTLLLDYNQDISTFGNNNKGIVFVINSVLNISNIDDIDKVVLYLNDNKTIGKYGMFVSDNLLKIQNSYDLQKLFDNSLSKLPVVNVSFIVRYFAKWEPLAKTHKYIYILEVFNV